MVFMSFFAVTYDLNKAKDYRKLYALLGSASDWARPSDSHWIIESNANALAWNLAIRKVVDSDDFYDLVDITSEVLAGRVNGQMLPAVLAWLEKKRGVGLLPPVTTSMARLGHASRIGP